MARDRFSEFQQHFAANSQWSTPNDNSRIENGLQEIDVSRLTYETSDRSQKFLKHVNELRDSIDNLETEIHNLQKQQLAVLSQSTVCVEQKDQLAKLINEIKLTIRSLRPKVHQIEQDLRRDEALASIERRTGAEMRIRRNQCEVLRLRINDLLDLFNHTQNEYKSRVSKRVKRQLDLAGEHLSSSQVDEMLESKSQEVFYRQLTPISFAAQLALDDATTRHKEILNLEQSIIELNEIFCDMRDLVYSQNKAVDHIAVNVESANNFVHNGRVHVTHAVTYKKSSQRKKCILILAVVSFALILIIILFIFFANFFSGSAKL